jgi:RNA polymerase sigma factor (sigma-70 family)
MLDEERNTLIIRHRLLACKIARHLWDTTFARKIGTYEDVEQECLLALGKAVEEFDPALGYAFSTYARQVICNAVKARITESGLLRVPLTTAMNALGVGRSPIGDETRRAALAALRCPVTMPACFDRPEPEEEEEDPTPRQKLRAALLTLTEPQRSLVSRRYGLDGNAPHTLRELSDEAHITKEGMRQRLVTIRTRLKAYLETH